MNSVRMDKWLWAARFFKTRALAAKACDLGRIRTRDIEAKPARDVHAGDMLHIRTEGGDFEVEVLAPRDPRTAALRTPSIAKRSRARNAPKLAGRRRCSNTPSRTPPEQARSAPDHPVPQRAVGPPPVHKTRQRTAVPFRHVPIHCPGERFSSSKTHSEASVPFGPFRITVLTSEKGFIRYSEGGISPAR